MSMLTTLTTTACTWTAESSLTVTGWEGSVDSLTTAANQTVKCKNGKQKPFTYIEWPRGKNVLLAGCKSVPATPVLLQELCLLFRRKQLLLYIWSTLLFTFVTFVALVRIGKQSFLIFAIATANPILNIRLDLDLLQTSKDSR